MAKKTHVKVRMVPEAKPDSPFFYYVKKPAGGEKAKVKLKANKYNPATRKHEVLWKKNFHLIVNKLFFFFKISFFEVNISINHVLPNFVCYLRINLVSY